MPKTVPQPVHLKLLFMHEKMMIGRPMVTLMKSKLRQRKPVNACFDKSQKRRRKRQKMSWRVVVLFLQLKRLLRECSGFGLG